MSTGLYKGTDTDVLTAVYGVRGPDPLLGAGPGGGGPHPARPAPVHGLPPAGGHQPRARRQPRRPALRGLQAARHQQQRQQQQHPGRQMQSPCI